MRLLKTKEADIFQSDDLMGEEKSTPQEFRIDNIVRSFLENYPQINEGIALFSQLTGMKRIAILHAHGSVAGKQWMYQDGKKDVHVQSWVKKTDGKYAALVTMSCNPGGLTPKSKKSMLIIPDRNITTRTVISSSNAEESAQFTIIVPGIGEIDAYSIDYFIKQWREELARRK